MPIGMDRHACGKISVIVLLNVIALPLDFTALSCTNS
jgi:hypothetical protein